MLKDVIGEMNLDVDDENVNVDEYLDGQKKDGKDGEKKDDSEKK